MIETIDVLCFVFPTGSTFFLPLDEYNQRDPHKVMDAWKAQLSPEQLKLYTDVNAMGGFVWMHMLKADYDKLPATSLSCTITQALEASDA